jgi:hypothetical protein
MLLIIIVVAFILTIVLIECSALFSCVIEKKEKVENIYLDKRSVTDDKLEFLEEYTGKKFSVLEYNETVKLKLDNTSVVFFEDYDIFINNNYKLNKFIVYPIDKDSFIDIINYYGDIITIYVH